MRRILSTISSLIIVAVLAGCEIPQPTHNIRHIGIVLFGDSRQPQTDGFIDGMQKLGYETDRDIRYSIRNANNDRSQLIPIVNKLLLQKIDLLVAAGGLEADAAKQVVENRSIPVVVLFINGIRERNLVQNRRNPGWAVTGVDNLNAEISGKRVELIKSLLPNTKRILILYYKNIAPSIVGVERATEAAEKLGIYIDARQVSSRQDMRTLMENFHSGQFDAMLTVPAAPVDNALADIIIPNVKRLKLPLMTYSRPMAEAGALASYGANFYDLGKQSARLADKILNGIAANKIPFEIPKTFTYTLNHAVMRSLSVHLTEQARSQVNDIIND